MNYSQILSPFKKKNISIYSSEGKSIIKKYIKASLKGSASTSKKYDKLEFVEQTHFKIITYNVNWRAMKNKDLRKNIAWNIDSNGPYHFIALQEVYEFNNLFNESNIIKDMNFIHWNPETANHHIFNIKTADKQITEPINYKSENAEISLSFDTRYNLQYYVLGHLFDNGNQPSPGRPYILAIFDNLMPPLCYINIHQGHSCNIDNTIGKILDNINSIEKSSNDLNNTFLKNGKKDEILSKLKECRIIISGDFNKNQNDFDINKGNFLTKMKNVIENKRARTCCDSNGNNSNMSYKYDHILSSYNVPTRIWRPIIHSPSSDHLPVIYTVSPLSSFLASFPTSEGNGSAASFPSFPSSSSSQHHPSSTKKQQARPVYHSLVASRRLFTTPVPSARAAVSAPAAARVPGTNKDKDKKFQGYPMIHDGSFGSAVKGDGFCSIWAVLLGWSLLNKTEIINPIYFQYPGQVFLYAPRDDVFNLGYEEQNNIRQPTNLQELKEFIIDVGITILNILKISTESRKKLKEVKIVMPDQHLTSYLELSEVSESASASFTWRSQSVPAITIYTNNFDYTFTKKNLESLMIQLLNNPKDVSTIDSDDHFVILAMLLKVKIVIKDTTIHHNVPRTFGSGEDIIRISTDRHHYEVYHNEKNSDNFNEKFIHWFNFQYSS